MIQDIAPHIYDRSYRICAAEPEDYVLCIREHRVLLMETADGWSLPLFSQLPPAYQVERPAARYLFCLDGKDLYLLEPAQEETVSAAHWFTGHEVRAVRPIEVAFAAITGMQLQRWYRTRRYCGRCGERTEPSRTERALVCPQCGLIEYPKICPAVIVAITDGDRILLTRYRDRPYKNYALIAGYVEVGESLEETIHREVLEEVGVRVKNLRYYKSQPWSFSDTLLAGFYCELDGDDTITLQEDELSEGVWMHRSEMPSRKNDVSLTAEMMERFRLGIE